MSALSAKYFPAVERTQAKEKKLKHGTFPSLPQNRLLGYELNRCPGSLAVLKTLERNSRLEPSSRNDDFKRQKSFLP